MNRLYRTIVAELLDDIVTGAIPAAGQLPSLDEIAARHACSTGVAREAVRALEERRVVAVRPGHGQQVRETDEWALLDPDVLEATLLRRRDPQLLREAIEALRLLEVECAPLAVRRVTEGDLQQLAQTIARMRAATT